MSLSAGCSSLFIWVEVGALQCVGVGLVMVSPNQPPQPPIWYWTARGMDRSTSRTSKVLLEGVDEAGDDFVVRLETMQDALGLKRQSDPAKRLRGYLDKPLTWQEAQEAFALGSIRVVYSWESQAQYFPKDFEEDQQDFALLRERALSGDFGPEFYLEVITYERMLDELGY